MKAKNFYIIRAISFAIVSVVFMTSPLWETLDTPIWLTVILTLLFGSLSYWYFIKSKNVDAEEKVAYYAPPEDADDENKIAWYKRLLILGMGGFLILIPMTINELNTLESGESESAYLWWPLAWAYEKGGYWAPIALLMGLMVFVLFGISLKIKQLRSQ